MLSQRNQVSANNSTVLTAKKKMKFFIKDFFSNTTKSAVSYEFGHIY